MIGTENERLRYLNDLYPAWPGYTLWTLFLSRADRYPDRPCMFYQDECYTYGRMKELICKVSRSLYAHGVRCGDHVAVALYNTPLHYAFFFALSRLCAVRIPLNMQMKKDGWSFILRHSGAQWLVGNGLLDFDPTPYPALKAVIPCENEEAFLQSGNSISDFQIARMEFAHRDPDSIGDIMFTSGSTSFPKGVCIRQDAFLRSSYATCRTRCMEEGRRIFVPVPFYHVFACSEGILASVHVGGSIVVSDRKFSPQNTLYLLRKHDVTDIICVPLVAIELLDALTGSDDVSEKKPCPALHAAFISPAGPDWLWERFGEVFHIRDITTGYGMTECGATSTLTRPSDPADLLKSSVGKLKDAGAAGFSADDPHLLRIKICDPETGVELSAGQVGEIVCKGFTVTPGYYVNPDANRSAFTEDGWFKSGDLGSLTSTGLLSFDGRKNDMYKTNGENVSPINVEQVISCCPGVRQVEVVGVHHDKYGEVGVAFIDAGKENGAAETSRRVQKWCRTHLGSFQVPLYYIFEDQASWPRSATEKLQKGKLRQRASELTVSRPPYLFVLQS